MPAFSIIPIVLVLVVRAVAVPAAPIADVVFMPVLAPVLYLSLRRDLLKAFVLLLRFPPAIKHLGRGEDGEAHSDDFFKLGAGGHFIGFALGEAAVADFVVFDPDAAT